jgi:parallel beta-helix repeat protein
MRKQDHVMKPAVWGALAALACVPQLLAQGPSTRTLVVNQGNTTTIDEPGTYVLARDLDVFTDRVGIEITASGVSLDLGGHQIKGPGGKLGTGIRVTGAQSVSVSNGRLTNFAFGAVVNASGNVVLRGLQITGQGLPVLAPPPEVGIMIVQSRSVTVEDNSIYNTGLGIFVRGSMSWGNRIVHNNVTAGTNGILGICYNPAPTDPGGPRGDLVYANHVVGFGTGIQLSATSVANIVTGNTVVYSTKGIESANATNAIRDNQDVKLP